MSVSRCIQSPSAVKRGIILIPDISGFSEYIYSADLTHSQIVIASLLETIMLSNNLDLEVSEIEGDAILFFSFDESIQLEPLIAQCNAMFSSFHDKLKQFNNKNCSCGACQRLHEIGLKFILHYGKIGSVMIQDYCKLFGQSVVVAHGLLKNKIPINEYILATEDFIRALGSDSGNDPSIILEWEDGFSEMPGIGMVNFKYRDCSSVMNIGRTDRVLKEY